jgi:L-lactate dehydrogenase complex protein LldE
MGLEKVRSIHDTGASVCAAGDNSCLMQIGGLLHRQGAAVRCLHLAEILAATDAGDGLPPEGGSHPSTIAVASGFSRKALGPDR